MKISWKWIITCLYIIGIFAVTPFLPRLIQFASSIWSSSGVSRFVLVVEIIIALLILTLVIVFLKRKKSPLLLLSIGAIFLLSFIFYKFNPNPYEFTHFPEYAVLSILVIRALDKGKGSRKDDCRIKGIGVEKGVKSVIFKNSYFLSGGLTGIVGTGDEIYQHFLPNRFFAWYDIFLNLLGGILGLLVFWGAKRKT